MEIQSHYVNPPIPSRDYDWSATFEGYEPGDVHGHGKTEQDAISDLFGELEERKENENP